MKADTFYLYQTSNQNADFLNPGNLHNPHEAEKFNPEKEQIIFIFLMLNLNPSPFSSHSNKNRTAKKQTAENFIYKLKEKDPATKHMTAMQESCFLDHTKIKPHLKA